MALDTTAASSTDPYWQLATAQVPVERRRESGTQAGDQNASAPDTAGHVGVDQIGQAALDDVNKSFSTNYTLDDLRTDPAASDDVARSYNYLLAKQLGPAALQNPALVRMAYRVGIAGMKRGDYLRIGAGDTYAPDVPAVARDLNIGGAGNTLAGDFGTFQKIIGTPDSSWMAPTMTALRANLTAERAELGGVEGEQDANRKADRARVKEAFDASSKDDTTPWTQKPPPPETLQAFASAGSIFAAIASAFTRTPAISAMNGMAAAINARRDGNQKAYDEAYKVWQDNTKLAIDRQKLASDRLTQALELMRTDSADGFSRAKQIMLEHGDERGLIMLEAGMYQQLADANAARDRVAANLAIGSAKINNPGWKSEVLTDTAVKNPDGSSPQYIRWTNARGESRFTTIDGSEPYTPKSAGKLAAGVAGGANPLTPEAVDFQAEWYLRTGQISAGFGGQAMRAQIMNRASELAKEQGHSVDDYISGVATWKADTSSLTAITKVKNAAAGYEAGANRALDLTESLIPPTPEPLDSQLLTRWARTGETQFGDVSVPKYMAALITALDQYAKIITGATGAQGSTDAARNLALSLIPAGATTAQIKGTIEVLKQDMRNKIAGYDEQIGNMHRDLAQPSGTTPATSAAQPAAHELPDGSIVTQGGVKYRKQGEQWVPVQ